jgi:adenosine deaminase
MPKVELHVHLGGRPRRDAVWAMARRNGARSRRHAPRGWRDFYAFRDFDHFLRVYTAAAGTMRTAATWAFMAEHFAAARRRSWGGATPRRS